MKRMSKYLQSLALFIFIIVIWQGNLAEGRSHLPFLPTDEGIKVNNAVSRSLGLPDSNGIRRPRNIASILSLLWPQVVGPIDNGIIKEEGYDQVPKTPLEHQLETVREKARLEAITRHHVRDLLNHGTSAAKLSLQQLHALHNDIGLFFDRHHHHPAQHPMEHHGVLVVHGAPTTVLHHPQIANPHLSKIIH